MKNCVLNAKDVLNLVPAMHVRIGNDFVNHTAFVNGGVAVHRYSGFALRKLDVVKIRLPGMSREVAPSYAANLPVIPGIGATPALDLEHSKLLSVNFDAKRVHDDTKDAGKKGRKSKKSKGTTFYDDYYPNRCQSDSGKLQRIDFRAIVIDGPTAPNTFSDWAAAASAIYERQFSIMNFAAVLHGVTESHQMDVAPLTDEAIPEDAIPLCLECIEESNLIYLHLAENAEALDALVHLDVANYVPPEKLNTVTPEIPGNTPADDVKPEATTPENENSAAE